MVAKANTLQIHGTYESMTNFHGHEQYTMDPCDKYEVASMATKNTKWIHVKVDHSHKEIHNGTMSQDQQKRISGTKRMNKLILYKCQSL
jgi:hypothetical protein